MGGLKAVFGIPAPKYEWQMLYADTGKLFMHFNVRQEGQNFSMEACKVPGGYMQVTGDWTAGQLEVASDWFFLAKIEPGEV